MRDRAPTSPWTLGQQRFALVLILAVSLLLAVGLTVIWAPKELQAACFTIISTALASPLRDAYHHYFPRAHSDEAAK
jgi:hypothetical protein